MNRTALLLPALILTAAGTLGLTGCSALGAASAAGSSASHAPSTSSPSSSSSSSSSQAPLDLCTLVPADQAGKAVGIPFTKCEQQTLAPGQFVATYLDGNGNNMGMSVYPGYSGVSFDSALAPIKVVEDPKPVAGLGDKAEVGESELVVQQGDTVFVGQGAFDDGASTTALVKLYLAAIR